MSRGQGWGLVHRYLYLLVLKFIFSRTCLYFVLKLQKCTCTQVHYKVLGTVVLEGTYIASILRFVKKNINIYYNLLSQLLSAIFSRILFFK